MHFILLIIIHIAFVSLGLPDSILGSAWPVMYKQFEVLCLWAIPYGFGAGGVDATLNNYVALHYASRHMSWLHCFWEGIEAILGVSGNAKAAAEAYLQGSLKSTGSVCHEHQHHGECNE